MARKKQTAEEAAKSRLLARGRKLMKDVQRYRTFGFVTRSEDYEADDLKLIRAIDRLYDSARREGLAEDAELEQHRKELRDSWSAARRGAIEIRASKFQAAADQLRAAARAQNDPAFDSYRQELELDEARRRARRSR